MACSATTTITAACTSGIGKVTDEITLLQIIAELSAERLVVAVPATDITVAAIIARACTSGIGKETDPTVLLQLIAQSVCEMAP